MKKLLGLSLLAIGFLALSGRAEAASGVRGAKGSTALTYSTSVSTITQGAAALYSVILSTGAASEYITLFDSASVTGLTSSGVTGQFKTRVFFANTSSNTIVNFDPPLQFSNGLAVVDSAATGQALFVWEKGRVTQGY